MQDDLAAVIDEIRDVKVVVAMPHRALPAEDGHAFEMLAEVGDAFGLDGEQFAEAIATLDHLFLDKIIVDYRAGDDTSFLAVVEPLLGFRWVDLGRTHALVVERFFHPFGMPKRSGAVDGDDAIGKLCVFRQDFDFHRLRRGKPAILDEPLRERATKLALVSSLDDSLEVETLGFPVHRVCDSPDSSCGLIVLIAHCVFAGYCTIFSGVFACLGLLPNPPRRVFRKR